LDQNLNNKLEQIMSQITDFAAKCQASLDKVSGDLDSITTDIAALNTLIQTLQNSPGTLGPADQAALDTIATNAAALATKADGVVPPVLPPVPTP
jgi:outer membrane murein-binding lipoprotein Lpp